MVLLLSVSQPLFTLCKFAHAEIKPNAHPGAALWYHLHKYITAGPHFGMSPSLATILVRGGGAHSTKKSNLILIKN